MINNEVERLDFESILWILFIVLGILNIYGNQEEKEYIETNNKDYEKKANKIFKITLSVTLLIYLYFFY